MISHARLLEVLRYDEETGIFTRADGRVTGCLNKNGYVLIGVDYKLYYAHRLAWLYVHGELPPRETDHINRDRADNRIANLRLASNHQNQANRKVRRDSGSQRKGTVFHKASGLWAARITVHGKVKSLGYYKTLEDAASAYEVAASEHFGEFARAA